jgi:hypothetical protein
MPRFGRGSQPRGSPSTRPALAGRICQ